jgi:Outer membrane protein beta-barrel domain
MNGRLNVRLAGLLASLALLGTSLPAAAVELTPLVGVRFGGNFNNNDCYCYQSYPSLNLASSASYGGELDVPFAHGPYALELYFSHQNTNLNGGQYLQPQIHDMNVNVIHAGVAAALPTNDKNFSWLLIASGGATVLDVNSYSQTYPSLGLGVGFRWMANEHVGLRADVRGIFTFVNNGNSVVVCNGGCSGYYSGSTFVQGEASLGLVLRF